MSNLNKKISKPSLTSSIRGFTLIELLIVITIISILSAVILVAVNQARSNARDKDRLAQLKQLQAAIEIYGQTNGRYPPAGCGRGTQWTSNGSSYGSCEFYISGITDLMNPLPKDPTNTVHGYLYRVDANGTNYKIMSFASLEATVVDSSNEHARCPSTCTSQSWCQFSDNNFKKTYAAYSPGAQCW